MRVTAPFIVSTITVTAVARLSPSFTRIEFGGPELADFGTDGPFYDQRIKFIFPPAGGVLPRLDIGDSWYQAWLALPDEERGAMRTYSVRDLVGDGMDTRLIVDFVLHLVPGATGPASTWASTAAPGDRLLVIGPRRGAPSSGIEFRPGDADRLLLAGDETAVPAIGRILADLPADASGAAFLEVPTAADILPIDAPAGVEVTWLPREGGLVGSRLVPAVTAHLGAATARAVVERELAAALVPAGADEEIWETPTFSGAGEAIEQSTEGIDGLYAWIAGESGVVTTIRRHLVRDVGVDRKQVAFMGYWRVGVAMKA